MRLGNHVPLHSPCVSPQKVPSRTFPVAFRSDDTICWLTIRDGAIRWSASHETKGKESVCVCVCVCVCLRE
jgi:hypothetical protein